MRARDEDGCPFWLRCSAGSWRAWAEPKWGGDGALSFIAPAHLFRKSGVSAARAEGSTGASLQETSNHFGVRCGV